MGEPQCNRSSRNIAKHVVRARCHARLADPILGDAPVSERCRRLIEPETTGRGRDRGSRDLDEGAIRSPQGDGTPCRPQPSGNAPPSAVAGSSSQRLPGAVETEVVAASTRARSGARRATGRHACPSRRATRPRLRAGTFALPGEDWHQRAGEIREPRWRAAIVGGIVSVPVC
jgi:hypothetical protein